MELIISIFDYVYGGPALNAFRVDALSAVNILLYICQRWDDILESLPILRLPRLLSQVDFNNLDLALISRCPISNTLAPNVAEFRLIDIEKDEFMSSFLMPWAISGSTLEFIDCPGLDNDAIQGYNDASLPRWAYFRFADCPNPLYLGLFGWWRSIRRLKSRSGQGTRRVRMGSEAVPRLVEVVLTTDPVLVRFFALAFFPVRWSES
ncbi:hypothetical protein Hypma_005682 [Hypsizygus marmoreus]|uniref:Uncharacterized protein n=1 Tax=Hypsizygus marmoreus TaxID=39966 RepID=A0A369JW18_HYPMA|nr:hypothetical protein Hypma_005682 [Hypsizygus marmoreus]